MLRRARRLRATVTRSSAPAGRNSSPSEPDPFVKSRSSASAVRSACDRRGRRTGTSRAATSPLRRGTPQRRARSTAGDSASAPRASNARSRNHPPRLPFNRPTARCDPMISSSVVLFVNAVPTSSPSQSRRACSGGRRVWPRNESKAPVRFSPAAAQGEGMAARRDLQDAVLPRPVCRSACRRSRSCRRNTPSRRSRRDPRSRSRCATASCRRLRPACSRRPSVGRRRRREARSVPLPTWTSPAPPPSVAAVPRSTVTLPLAPGHRPGRNLVGDDVDQAADRVGAIEQRGRAAHDFDPLRPPLD